MPHALVIVRVAEVEPYVARLRQRFDPAARRGLGAHVTLLHAPLPSAGIDAAMRASIAAAAAGSAAFRYAVTGLAHFPGTLYLAIDPWEPFKELHAHLAPQEAGAGRAAQREFIPHISVVRKARRSDPSLAQGDDAIDAIPVAEAELIPLLDAAPIPCECREIVLLEDSTGLWRPVQAFALDGAQRL